MANLEGLWAERFSYCKQQFPKVSQRGREMKGPFFRRPSVLPYLGG
jgi:hypothetical protein